MIFTAGHSWTEYLSSFTVKRWKIVLVFLVWWNCSALSILCPDTRKLLDTSLRSSSSSYLQAHWSPPYSSLVLGFPRCGPDFCKPSVFHFFGNQILGPSGAPGWFCFHWLSPQFGSKSGDRKFVIRRKNEARKLNGNYGAMCVTRVKSFSAETERSINLG